MRDSVAKPEGQAVVGDLLVLVVIPVVRRHERHVLVGVRLQGLPVGSAERVGNALLDLGLGGAAQISRAIAQFQAVRDVAAPHLAGHLGPPPGPPGGVRHGLADVHALVLQPLGVQLGHVHHGLFQPLAQREDQIARLDVEGGEHRVLADDVVHLGEHVVPRTSRCRAWPACCRTCRTTRAA